MNVAQMEHANANIFADPLPSRETLERLKQLVRAIDAEEILVKNKQMELERYNRLHAALQTRRYRNHLNNQITQSQIRQRLMLDEMVRVAGDFYAEYAAKEILEVTQ